MSPAQQRPHTTAAIVELFLQGRRVSEVIAHGLTHEPSWRRQHVIDVIAARGWKLDSDGRIPRQHRTSTITPLGTLPGAPPPAPGRPASWPDRGSREATEPPQDSASALLNQGKAHSAARVRNLAERAEKLIIELRAALSAESERDQIRLRLAELDAERDRLRAQLAGAGPRTTTGRPRSAPSTKPIDHGSERGARQHNLRGDPLCDACRPFQDVIVAKLRGAKNRTGDEAA